MISAGDYARVGAKRGKFHIIRETYVTNFRVLTLCNKYLDSRGIESGGDLSDTPGLVCGNCLRARRRQENVDRLRRRLGKLQAEVS